MKRRHSTGPAGIILSQLLLLSVALAAQAQKPAPWVGKTLYGKPCVGGQPTDGPYDYLNQPAINDKLALVERHHFTAGVRNLTKGASTSPMGDIDFVLRAFPNHHGALNSATRFSIQHKRHPPGEKGLPAECYLMRAMRYAPHDPVLPKIYGYYLQKKGRPRQALAMNKRAMSHMPGDAMLHYNTALILVDLQRYEEAMALARPLYDAGLTMPGLRNKLIRAGHWEYVGDERERFAQPADATEGVEDPEAPSKAPDTAGSTGRQEASVIADEGVDAAKGAE